MHGQSVKNANRPRLYCTAVVSGPNRLKGRIQDLDLHGLYGGFGVEPPAGSRGQSQRILSFRSANEAQMCPFLLPLL